MVLAIQDIPGVREAYAIGRELRGLAVREKALDKMFTVEAMVGALIIILVIYIFVFITTLRNKSYFESAQVHDEA
jgi:hypothetical protein